MIESIDHQLRRWKRWLSGRRYLWREYYRTGEYELLELRRLVRPSSSALDVGSNIGVYAYHLNRFASKVIAFEPNPEYVQRILALRLPRVTVEQVALSDRAGELDLRIPLSGGREDKGMASIETHVVPDAVLSRAFTVQVRRLDDYHFTDLGFIKIDVEGHEERILHGAQETILRNRPIMLIEIEERHNPGGLKRVGDMMTALGYRCHFYENGMQLPLTSFDQEHHQPANLAWNAATHTRRKFPYVNNFVFVPQ